MQEDHSSANLTEELMQGLPSQAHLKVLCYGVQDELDLLLGRLRPGCDLCAAVCSVTMQKSGAGRLFSAASEPETTILS